MSSAIGKPTCRNVIEVSFEREGALGEEHIAFTITGNAFLHSMVRTIVGTSLKSARVVEIRSGFRGDYSVRSSGGGPYCSCAWFVLYGRGI